MVRPTPLDAGLEPSAPCTLIRRRAPEVCAFGAARPTPVTVALLGDSHAVHWRAALSVVAAAERWRGVSITRSQCPFSLARKPGDGRCLGWARRALGWLRDHPTVHTIFVSANATSGILAPPGQASATKIAGFIRAWKALPASVREVFVLHDVPYSSTSTQNCVEQAIARHRNAGIRCTRPRSRALHPDFQAMAAKQLGAGQVKVVDLTPFMCDASRCFPVIGGALVIKDIGHLTRTFSTTLGPALGRTVSRLRAAG